MMVVDLVGCFQSFSVETTKLMNAIQTISNLDVQHTMLLILVSMGILWYYLCLVAVGLRAAPVAPTTFQQYQVHSISTLSTILATFAGLLLGLGSGESESKQANEEIKQISDLTGQIAPKVQQDANDIKTNLKMLKMEKNGPANLDQSVDKATKTVEQHAEDVNKLATSAQKNLTTKSKIQPAALFKWGLVLIYIASLCLAVYFWWSNAAVDPVVPNLGKSLLGMIISAASIILVL
jgi:hypothetical protein